MCLTHTHSLNATLNKQLHSFSGSLSWPGIASTNSPDRGPTTLAGATTTDNPHSSTLLTSDATNTPTYNRPPSCYYAVHQGSTGFK